MSPDTQHSSPADPKLQRAARRDYAVGLTCIVLSAIFFATAGVLCKLISRGALISMAVILLVLPALLVITEPILRKTTFHWLKKPEITEKKA